MSDDADIVERLRMIADLWDGYKGLVATEILHPNDIGNDPDVLREAADLIEAFYAYKRNIDQALNSGDGVYRP